MQIRTLEDISGRVFELRPEAQFVLRYSAMWNSTGLRSSMASPSQPLELQSSTPSQLSTLDPDADPPKVLAVGPDPAGNFLEVIWLGLADDVQVVIHAMALRPVFYELLPPGKNS